VPVPGAGQVPSVVQLDMASVWRKVSTRVSSVRGAKVRAGEGTFGRHQEMALAASGCAYDGDGLRPPHEEHAASAHADGQLGICGRRAIKRIVAAAGCSASRVCDASKPINLNIARGLRPAPASELASLWKEAKLLILLASVQREITAVRRENRA
jgi:hypothetical protein